MSITDRYIAAAAGRPEVALVTNHGYAGVEIPVGGAPDTGGQNFYVNQLAAALSKLGYAVTIFARGGFPFFGSDRVREQEELLSERVRYVYVPGGGDTFIRKEDIALALDEQAPWLVDFVAREAARKGCRPWRVYEFVNTHYWDAAVLGVRLVERWADDVAAGFIEDALGSAVAPEVIEAFVRDRYWTSPGLDPAFHVGDLLAGAAAAATSPSKWGPASLERWSREADVVLPDGVARRLGERIDAVAAEASPVLSGVYARRWLGEAVMDALGAADRLRAALAEVDTHVWTPHSIGELKDVNYRRKPLEVRRDLKFCERRSHERMVCARTRAFAATSAEIAEHLVSRLGVAPEAIFYFPPCVDRNLFRRYGPEEVDRTYGWLAERTGVAEEALRSGLLVFETSRQDATKRKDVLLRAFARVAADVPDAFLLIGGGPENEVFRANLSVRDSDPALAGRAFLLGFIPDDVMYPLFDVADVFVTPSEMEGFGMSASQAAAAGTALVTSDLVPFSVLYAPEDALIVRAGDVEGFASAIRRLLLDPSERARRAVGLERATRGLDWDVQTRAFIEHVRRRTGSAPSPGKEAT